MIIGLILAAFIAVITFFRVGDRYIKGFGLPKLVILLMLAALIGCVFIPEYTVANISIGFGVLLPALIISVVFLFVMTRTELKRALLGIIVCLALTIAIKLLLNNYNSEYSGLVISLIVGFACGASAFLTCKTKTAGVCAVLCGIVLGEITSELLIFYLIDNTYLTLGGLHLFDALMIALTLVGFLCAVSSAVVKARSLSDMQANRTEIEAGVEFNSDLIDDDYRQYFDD